MSSTAPAPRPLRADARRNRARLVEAAQAVFAEHGTGASLDDVARRAGVGIGTLYRHFPTRDALVAAVIDEDTRRLCRLSEGLSAADDPFEALRSWLRELVNHLHAYDGLARSISDGAACGDGPLGQACLAMAGAGTALFARAQRSGLVRQDATALDAFDLATSIAWRTEGTEGTGRADHLLALALDGLRRPAR